MLLLVRVQPTSPSDHAIMELRLDFQVLLLLPAVLDASRTKQTGINMMRLFLNFSASLALQNHHPDALSHLPFGIPPFVARIAVRFMVIIFLLVLSMITFVSLCPGTVSLS
jgi:hypothetical protein